MFSEGYFGWKVHPCRDITHYTGKREGAREWCQGVEQVIPRCRHPPSPLFGHEYDGGGANKSNLATFLCFLRLRANLVEKCDFGSFLSM